MTDPCPFSASTTADKPGPKRRAGARYPGGKLKPFKTTTSPVLVRRMIETARAGAADPLLATPVGWLLLQGRLNPLQVGAAQDYARSRARYDQAIDAPARTSVSPSYGGAYASHGTPLAPEEEAARAVRAKRRFQDLRDCFPVRQARIIALLDRTCVENAHPALYEQEELAAALSRLAVHFGLTAETRKR